MAQARPDPILLLVVPQDLTRDMMFAMHSSFEGGHQGIIRTYNKLKPRYYWRGMFADVQRFVLACTDCSTGKGQPWIRGKSPGNLLPLYPFHVVSMDFVTDLPKTSAGIPSCCCSKTCSGYVLCKPLPNRMADTVAQAYESVVYQRFGASAEIRHDETQYSCQRFSELSTDYLDNDRGQRFANSGFPKWSLSVIRELFSNN